MPPVWRGGGAIARTGKKSFPARFRREGRRGKQKKPRGRPRGEFEAHGGAGAASNSKDGENTFPGPVPTRTPAAETKTAESAPSAVVPEKKTRRLRCRAPTGRSSAA